MAFQTGTQVNPSLGALDFSGFTNAANIQASSLASLGDAIGGAIEKYNRKKEDEVNIKALAELLGDPKLAKAVYNDDVVRSVYLFNKKQQQAKELAEIEANELTLGEQQRANLMNLYPGMPMPMVDDIAAGRTEPIKTAEGNIIGYSSPSFGGQKIDYDSYKAPPLGQPTGTPSTEVTDPVIEQGVRSTQPGLLSQYFELRDQGLSPFGLKTDITSGVQNISEYIVGGSPIKVDPRTRTFIQNLQNINNTFLDSLREGDRYTVTEIENIEKAFKNVIDPSTTSQFEIAVPAASKYLEELILRDEEKLKRNLNTAARIKLQDRIADLQFVKQQLGADEYAQQESTRTGLPVDVQSERDFLKKQMEALQKFRINTEQ
jgi:hypothetical protein